MAQPENPFVFGEIIDDVNFVDRTEELDQLVKDLGDGQKVFLLSPRRFGKSSLVSVALLRLQKKHVHPVNITVSNYSSYTQFLEKFAEKVLRAAGSWQHVKDWVKRFVQRVKPQAGVDLATGEISVSFGKGTDFNPEPIAEDVFALPGELARNGGFRMAICLDEFQQISEFDGRSVEENLRNAAQRQREVGYVFAGSQPSLMEEMLSPKRPLHRAGPKMFLDKIPADAWKEFISRKFRKRGRIVEEQGLEALLSSADLIPYDVQRIAHELWDEAERKDKRQIQVSDVNFVIEKLATKQSPFYEAQWEQVSARQRAALQAIACRGVESIYSESVRQEFRLGAASSVQKSLEALDSKDILDIYKNNYFFIDPLFAHWIRKRST